MVWWRKWWMVRSVTLSIVYADLVCGKVRITPRGLATLCCSAALFASPVALAAQSDSGAAWAFKLTPSYYATSHSKSALDLNLRADYAAHAVWLGEYKRGSEFEQTRIGYEYTAALAHARLVPSVQWASHGFLGGSLNAEIGEAVYAMLGVGRTNTRDYYNLNFDPNDAYVYGVGTRLLAHSNVSLFTVKDNRLNTGQIITHAVWRYQQDEQQRWTIDVSNKHGRATVLDEFVTGNALAITYDYRDVFVRLAQDQKVNFSIENQTRVSLGLRF